MPPGQFAFLLTEEVVHVPLDAIAFISIRATIKFRGLVNVSGFHVDPGYGGRLVFSVFNAGPAPVHLERGEACFLIWFASLDGETRRGKAEPGFSNIPTRLINPIAGEIQSFEGLLARIKENDKKATDRLNAIEREQAVVRWGTMLIVGAIVAFVLRACMPWWTPLAAPTLTSTSPPARSPPDAAQGSPPASPRLTAPQGPATGGPRPLAPPATP